MKRINYLVDLIKPCQNVIDIGSDHAYLAVGVLTLRKAQFVVNIEINENPLKQGILNLTKLNLLNKTLNLKNDGFNGLESKLSERTFDYAVISGMGANSIIDIMQVNELQIKTFILQPNNHEANLRKWLSAHRYVICSEHFIQERQLWYPIFVVRKKPFHKYYLTKSNLLLGNKKSVFDQNQYLGFLNNKLLYVQQLNERAKDKQQVLEKCLKQRIEWTQKQIKSR